jgi:hypothetical protein
MLVTQGKPLKHWSRGTTPTTEIVIHESVTRGRDTTLKVLANRGLSVHLTIDLDGTVEQHAPLDRQCAHAGSPHNKRSVAVEVINRYYGDKAIEGEIVIDAVWAHKGKYIVPPAVQLEGVWQTVMHVTSTCPTIRRVFPGVVLDVFVWGRFPWLRKTPTKRPPGIAAHHRWDHADGLVPEFYCVLRDLGHAPDAAYQLTLAAASSGLRATPVEAPGAT